VIDDADWSHPLNEQSGVDGRFLPLRRLSARESGWVAGRERPLRSDYVKPLTRATQSHERETRAPLVLHPPGRWYTGAFPQIYDDSQVPAAKILKDNYAVIRKEVLDYFATYGSTIEPTFTPYAYKEAGWRTLNLYAQFMRYNEPCSRLPETTKIVESIPSMCSAQVALLYPNTRVRPHFADTSVLVRTHIGIQIPGTLPDIGMRVKKHVICWKEARSSRFCPGAPALHVESGRTASASCSRSTRIGRSSIGAGTSSAGTSWPRWRRSISRPAIRSLRKMPRPLVIAAHRGIGIPIGVFLWLQDKTGFDTAGWMAKLKRT
jgi:hypothetical protein